MSALDVCKNCSYREEDICEFDPSKNTIIPACHYSFPAIKIIKLKIK